MPISTSKADKTKYHINYDFRPGILTVGDSAIVQIGRRYTDGGAVIERHAHLNWFELTVVTKGGCEITTNEEKIHVGTGEIYLSYPYDIHEIIADKDGLEYDFFSFCPPGDMKEEFERITREHIGADTRAFKDERIGYLVRAAISEFDTKKPYADEVIHGITAQMLAYIIRDFDEIRPQKKGVTKSDILCQEIMSYIDTHVYDIENLEAIADIFNYNYSYLSALFKRTTKKTLADYYRTRRLETAYALISEGKTKINEVSEMLGYSSPFAFSNAFKNKYGVSPKSIKNK